MGLTPLALDSLDLARWQFGITTVYHFILVPLTIGLAPLVALMETLYLRTGKEHWKTATKFFGKLLLINFALGVATGIVQEFQFGMNWSEYSRFVGNIFGAPLAFEALLAFFLESTFLGLWIFGWDRLSPKLHNLCIWMVAIGVNISAFFILAANSWMQHPVGAVVDEETGRAVLDGLSGFFAVLSNSLLWTTIFHTVSTAFLVAGAMIAGVSVWWMTKAAAAGKDFEARDMWRRLSRFGAIAMVVAGALTMVSGHAMAQIVTKEQPAKMAAAEMLCETENGAGFTIAAFGSCEDGSATHIGTVPNVLSFLATNDPNGEVMGLKDAQEFYAEQYGETDAAGNPVDYTPNEMVTFWSFRAMIGLGGLSFLFGCLILWLTRKDRLITNKTLGVLALWSTALPFLAASFGWIMAEMGRQPWIVSPNLAAFAANDPVAKVHLLTSDGLSTVVGSASVLTSMVIFTLLYAVLGVVWFVLLRRYVREGVRTPQPEITDGEKGSSAPLSFEY